MKIKVSEATRIQLDWMVAKCEGPRVNGYGEQVRENRWFTIEWEHGGPIIEREGININIQNDDHGNKYSGKARWWAQMDCRIHTAFGPTPLIAAMRCFCVSRLGPEVEVPDELI